jgi:hypothetical protein
MSRANSLASAFSARFDRDHGAVTLVILAVVAVLLGGFASWIAADFLPRLPTAVVVALAGGAVLYEQPDRRAVLAASCYLVATLVTLAPLVYQLALALAVPNPLAHVASTTDALVVLLAWLPAGLFALAGYLLSVGPLVPRIRSLVGS